MNYHSCSESGSTCDKFSMEVDFTPVAVLMHWHPVHYLLNVLPVPTLGRTSCHYT